MQLAVFSKKMRNSFVINPYINLEIVLKLLSQAKFSRFSKVLKIFRGYIFIIYIILSVVRVCSLEVI